MPNSQKNQKYNLSKKEIDFNNQMYRDFISTYGETAEGLGWHSQQQQEKRFEIMLKILDFSKKPMKGMSVLDVGCGFGDFYSYLNQQFRDFNYTGIDINPDILAIAGLRHKKARFIHGDILNLNLDKYDFIFCSGLFATKLEDNEQFIQDMITKMYELCNIGIAFNFLQKTKGYSELAEYDKSVILKFCKEKFKKAKLLSDYIQDDATIFILK